MHSYCLLVNMRLDRILLQLRVISHRLQQTKQKKTEDMLFKRASEIVRRNRLSLSRFLENPLVARWTEHMEETARTVRSQCSAFCAQRMRRSTQIFSFYKDLYGDSFVLRMFTRLRETFTRVGNRPFFPRAYLCAAAVFCWKDERITEDHIQGCIEDMKKLEKNLTCTVNSDYMQSWECVVSREDFKVWRKPLEGTDLYQYKMYGTYKDVSPRAMFQVQKDLDYRKTWDSNVIDLRILDTDTESGSEVVHWVTYYPYPMYSREYVYVRNCKVDTDNNVMVVMAGAVEHPSVPVKDCYVRVTAYHSEMVIKPHKTFDENGLDYVLTYYDDPQAVIPSVAYHWMASKGVPGYVDKIRSAAKHLQDTNPQILRMNESNNNYSLNTMSQ